MRLVKRNFKLYINQSHYNDDFNDKISVAQIAEGVVTGEKKCERDQAIDRVGYSNGCKQWFPVTRLTQIAKKRENGEKARSNCEI